MAAGLILFALGTASGIGAEPDSLAPYLEAEPSPAGALTWWLISPVQRDAFDNAAPPTNARASTPFSNNNADRWSLFVSPQAYVDLTPTLLGANGTAWAMIYIQSQTGGNRELRIGTWSPLHVYKDGALIANRPAPTGRDPDETYVSLDLAKGVTCFTVAANSRTGFAAFYICLTQNRREGGRPVAGDKILIPTEPGKAADSATAALNAIAFESRDRFVKAGDIVPLAVGIRGSTPLLPAPLSARVIGPDKKSFGPAFPARLASDLAKSAWTTEYKVANDDAPQTELTLEVSSGDKVLGNKTISLFSFKALGTSAAALSDEIKHRIAKSSHDMPCAELAVERAQLFLTKAANGEEPATPTMGETVVNLLTNAKTYAALEEQGKDPWENHFGYFERAYRSRIDNGVQPYFVQVPSSFSQLSPGLKKNPAKRFPLVIFLHGYVPNYDKHRWWEEFSEFNSVFERQGAFLAIPFGRSNSDYQGCGETDVLDVIAEIKRLYPIDEDRVYLYGYSMGGQGVYTVAAHHPDLFAAGIVLAGRADNPLQNFRALDTFHPFKQWLIHADNPISLCENFLNVPLRIFHGKDDSTISVGEAQRMEKRLKEIGCDVKLTALPGTHKFGLDVMMTDEPVKWLLEQRRQPSPSQCHMKAYSLKYAAQGGVQVLADLNVPLSPIDLEWTVKDGKTEFTKDRQNCFRSVNGKADPLPKGLIKTPGCCGPVREATAGPFMVVYGTSGSAEANARNLKMATQFADDWYVFAKSRAILRADKDVTEQEKKTRHLFLFGEAQENALHAAAAANLPFVVKNGEAVVGDKKIALADRGIMYVYPSPFSEPGDRRMVVICAGIQYGPKIGTNHKLDLVPDFLIYSSQQDTDTTSTNHAICAGFFDGEWKLNPNTMWWFEQ